MGLVARKEILRTSAMKDNAKKEESGKKDGTITSELGRPKEQRHRDGLFEG
jgi:hypothetical protein